MTHSWCRDIQRDESVRAAEDNRQGPLPTLEECISRAGQFTPSEAPQGAKCTERESGMRTERVTIPWQREKWDEALAVIVNGGEWGRGNGFHAGIIAALVIWADKTMVDLTAERDAAIREREEWRRSFVHSEEAGTRLLAERNAALDEADGLRARVRDWERVHQAAHLMASLESAPAASGAANSSESPVSSEPRAYWVQWKTDTVIDKWTFQSTFPTREAAAEYIDEYAEEDDQPEIVPFFTAPPPARGWLTPDEIAVCVGLRDYCRGTWETWGRKDTLWLNRATTLDALLARETPPEVVAPDQEFRSHSSALRDAEWIAALTSAGVAVKEVGRE